MVNHGMMKGFCDIFSPPVFVMHVLTHFYTLRFFYGTNNSQSHLQNTCTKFKISGAFIFREILEPQTASWVLWFDGIHFFVDG